MENVDLMSLQCLYSSFPDTASNKALALSPPLAGTAVALLQQPHPWASSFLRPHPQVLSTQSLSPGSRNRSFAVAVELLNRGRLFCDPLHCSPQGSSVHGILQARILERVAISTSRGCSRPRDQTCVSWLEGDSLPLIHLGSPTV